jgi:hypothetical protein
VREVEVRKSWRKKGVEWSNGVFDFKRNEWKEKIKIVYTLKIIILHDVKISDFNK